MLRDLKSLCMAREFWVGTFSGRNIECENNVRATYQEDEVSKNKIKEIKLFAVWIKFAITQFS